MSLDSYGKRVVVVVLVLALLAIFGMVARADGAVTDSGRVGNEWFQSPPGSWMGKHVSFGFESYRGCEAVYDHVLVMHPKGVIWQTFPVTGGEEHMRYYVVSCDNTGPGAFRVKYKDAHGTILAEHTKYFAGGGVRFMAWHTVPDGAVEGQLSIHNWHSWDKPVTLRQAGLK